MGAVDIGTTRSSIVRHETKTGVKVAIAPVIAPSEDGKTSYGLALSGRF